MLPRHIRRQKQKTDFDVSEIAAVTDLNLKKFVDSADARMNKAERFSNFNPIVGREAIEPTKKNKIPLRSSPICHFESDGISL